MATISLSDATTVTGASSGSVLVEQTTTISNLTTTQKNALIAFLNTLGLPGSTANLVSVAVHRRRGTPNIIDCSVTGLIIPASATVALQNRSTYDDIIGVVP